MRILFLTQVLPYPLDAGPKVRAYYVLRHLAQTHSVTLASFVRASDCPEAVQHLARFCQAVYTVPMLRSRVRDVIHLAHSLLSDRPFIIARDWVPAMARLIDGLMAQPGGFSAVHADQLWMAPYALRARASSCAAGPPRLVLDQHNAVHLIPARMAQGEANPVIRALLAVEARKMARYEAATCGRFDEVVWVTQQDWQALEGAALGFSAPPAAVRRAVPRSAVIPICGDPTAVPPVARKPDARRVTFLGGLHWPPNAQGVRWFLDQVWPLVRAAVPNCTLTIIGKDPPKDMLGLAGPATGVEVTGYVADLGPLLAETAVFVVPLLAGGGMRVKIVDAWTWGLSVVSTAIGAEGMDVLPGENILIADAPGEFAAAVVSLLTNRDRNLSIGQAGRRWVEAHYSWRTVYREWDRLYPERCT